MAMLGKSNTSSLDNPLAYPVPVRKIQANSASSIIQQAVPNPGGITKSNFSSADNPLANYGYQSDSGQNSPPKRLPLEAYKKKPDYYGSYEKKPMQTPPQQDYYDMNQFQQQPPPPPAQSYQNEQSLERFKFQPLPPIQSSQPPYQSSNYNSMPFTPPQPPQPSPTHQQQRSSYEYNEPNNSSDYLMQEKSRIRDEADSLSQYPFGRRFNTEASSFTNNDYNHVTYPPEASMYNPNPPYARFIDEQPMRLNKDTIVEKANDMPPYDPIKHRTGNPQAFDYDPWGKPGGGAPIVDPSTGKKMTKKSGQAWYDKQGLNEDDRAKAVLDRNRPQTLDEQKAEMEKERERRRAEEADYKSRTGADVASWINHLDDQKKKIYAIHGAHIHSTDATKERIKNEQVKRNQYDVQRAYHDELGQQLEERNRSQQLHKLKDDVAGIEHARKWDQMWGRPGAGAPNADGRRKRVLDFYQMDQTTKMSDNGGLFGQGQRAYPSQNPGQDEYKSSHKNFYDREQPMKL